MGARADQQLAMVFLERLTARWSEHPGTYKVTTETDDLVPALAQICVQAFAADIRELRTHPEYRQPLRGPHGGGLLDGQVDGQLTLEDGRVEVPSVLDVCNKIVHGEPQEITVTDDGRVGLLFVNREPPPRTRPGNWKELRFFADSMLAQVNSILYVAPHSSESRNRGVDKLLDLLGTERILPSHADPLQR